MKIYVIMMNQFDGGPKPMWAYDSAEKAFKELAEHEHKKDMTVEVISLYADKLKEIIL